ncbi:hypothetical protein IV203_037367 [Nitzschia inconspicua]|uniref:Sulfotransferase n=1 Tax=Nitzschia inconspicua TaxID=303405 RepID=A0A9K3PYP3_9STRA|nr:hypothetical protein IV203_037367 [Nitzschia inconspicua]
MVFSVRFMERIIVGCFFIWLMLLGKSLRHQGPSSYTGWDKKKFQRIHPRKAPYSPNDNGNNNNDDDGDNDNANPVDRQHSNSIHSQSVQNNGPGSPAIDLGRHSSSQESNYSGDITYKSSKSNLKLPLPIIVMGFPKAGTSSIFAFFQRQGFRSQHWYCCNAQISPQKGGPDLMAGCMMKNLRRNHTNIFQGCGNDHIEVFSEINGPRKKKYHPLTGKVGFLQDDGTVDYVGPGSRIFLPQHFHIDRVHNAYPNATWILNLRDVDSWTTSVMEWGDDLQNKFFNEYYMQGVVPHIPPHNDTDAVNDLLRRIYEEHHDMVRDFVRRHPSHTLVEVNIMDENAGNVLGDAFGLDPQAWDNINVNKKRKQDYTSWKYKFDEFDLENSPIWTLLFVCTTVYLCWFLGVDLSLY